MVINSTIICLQIKHWGIEKLGSSHQEAQSHMSLVILGCSSFPGSSFTHELRDGLSPAYRTQCLKFHPWRWQHHTAQEKGHSICFPWTPPERKKDHCFRQSACEVNFMSTLSCWDQVKASQAVKSPCWYEQELCSSSHHIGYVVLTFWSQLIHSQTFHLLRWCWPLSPPLSPDTWPCISSALLATWNCHPLGYPHPQYPLHILPPLSNL